jgi:AcrR family transcriptional regulator
MTPGEEQENAVIDAALRVAARRSWRDVRLSDIAAEANLDLADLAKVTSSKADIVRRFSRRTDRALLDSLKTQPVEGEPHDRLFDVVMRRLEILTPHRAALASILEAPAGHPTGALMLAASAATTQRWMLTAAGLEEDGPGGVVKQGGLACVYARALRVWLSDDDPGLARTMAALDRDLRDGARYLRWAEMPIALGTALSGIVRGLWRGRAPRRDYDSPGSPSPREPQV